MSEHDDDQGGELVPDQPAAMNPGGRAQFGFTPAYQLWLDQNGLDANTPEGSKEAFETAMKASPESQEESVKVTSSEPESSDQNDPDEIRGNKSALPPRKPQNVTLDGPVSHPRLDKDDKTPGVSMPGDTDARLTEALSSIPNVKIAENASAADWSRVTSNGALMVPFDDTFVERLEDPKADFRQHVEHNGQKLSPAQGRFPQRENTVFSGGEAQLRAMAWLGLGSIFSTPLWNSGLWVTFKPPSEEGLVELHRLLTSHQILLGRSTYGMVYSAGTAYAAEHICNFAARHIYSIAASSDEIYPDNVLRFIKPQDITQFIWGFACTMYPNGYKYSRPCVANPARCQHVIFELLNVRKLSVVDNNALSEYQKGHMATYKGTNMKLKISDLEKYQTEMTRAGARDIVIHKGTKREITLRLRSPSVMEYFESSHRWIDSMVDDVKKLAGEDISPDERNTNLELKSRATLMRQYSHWVESIVMDSNIIEDVKDVETILGVISSDAPMREEFFDKVKKFIENSSVSVVGIPTFDCPVCKAANLGPDQSPFKDSMIPLDMLQLFFALLTQKHLALVNI